jgi:hypothetical protein
MDITSLHKKIETLLELAGPADLVVLGLQLDERIRQIVEEGKTSEFDDHNRIRGQLSSAAACYALASTQRTIAALNGDVNSSAGNSPHPCWPFSQLGAFRPASRLRMLTKSGALTQAEAARLVRAGDTK